MFPPTFARQTIVPAARCRWKRAFVVCLRSAMCGLGQSSGWARQSAREQSLWRNYMTFSQMMPLRRVVRAFRIKQRRRRPTYLIEHRIRRGPCHAQLLPCHPAQILISDAQSELTAPVSELASLSAVLIANEPKHGAE